MTITDHNNATSRPAAAASAEPEINVGPSAPYASPQSPGGGKFYANANDDPDIPVAFASVLDEKPSAAATTGPIPAYPAGDYASQVPPPPPPATAPNSNFVVQGSPVLPPTAQTPPPPHSQPIPPGAPPGGQWVMVKYTGNQTWGVIGGVGCVLFWCCAMVLAPCALFGLMCPCDETRAYMSPNGVMYDERGRAIGDSRRNKYKIIGKA